MIMNIKNNDENLLLANYLHDKVLDIGNSKTIPLILIDNILRVPAKPTKKGPLPKRKDT